MTNILATWTVELACTCPGCDTYTNLLDHPDFWDGRQLDVPEIGTDRSRGIEVQCTECGHEFFVDCAY